MVEFRKWFPALAIVALLLGSAVMASAQQNPAFACSTVAGVPPVVRSEGVAELVGDIVLNCTGGTPTPTTVGGAQAFVPGVNVSVFLNTNITSRLLTSSGLAEALLMIDDPAAGQQVPCIPVAPASNCFIAGVGGPGVNYRSGQVPNVYQGQYVLQAGNQPYLFWPGVPIDAPGTTGTRIIRITNIRANANGVGLGTTFIPGSIQAFVSITSTQPIALSLPAQGIQVAFTIRGLGTFNTQTGGGTASPFLQCLGNSVNPNGTSLRARFIEGFASAFKPRAYPHERLSRSSILTASDWFR